jgi:peptidoglycan/xylan/chitin deacetylase (PgdA/CDA1 family)
MSRRWHWDFEEERRVPISSPAPAEPLAPPAPPAEPLASPGDLRLTRAARVRRRRAVAGLAVVVVLAVILAILLGSHHRNSVSSASSLRGSHRLNDPKTGQARTVGGAREQENKAVSAVLAYTPFVRAGGDRSREVALTFDDGPGPYTPGVLSVLERYHVPATFFAIGKMERYFSPSTARELRDGDVVGDHTETHPAMAQLSAHEQHEQLFEQLARIELLGGPRPRLFRPPYGSFNATTVRELHALGLLMVLWSVDTGDYLQPGVAAIEQRVLAGAHPGAIFLMHDGGGIRAQTIAALPGIIRGLRMRGFRPVTVPRLLLDDPPPPGQPLPPSLSGD